MIALFFFLLGSLESGNFHDKITPGERVGGSWTAREFVAVHTMSGGVRWSVVNCSDFRSHTGKACITRVWADTGGNHICETTFPSPLPLLFLSAPISTPWHGQCPPPQSRLPASGSYKEREGGLHGAYGSILLIWSHCLKTYCLK